MYCLNFVPNKFEKISTKYQKLFNNFRMQKLIIVCIYLLKFANINYSLHLLNIVSIYYL
jgi:hypothetical protein